MKEQHPSYAQVGISRTRSDALEVQVCGCPHGRIWDQLLKEKPL